MSHSLGVMVVVKMNTYYLSLNYTGQDGNKGQTVWIDLDSMQTLNRKW